MKQAKRLCVGAAAAGIFGLGAVVTAAVAQADPASGLSSIGRVRREGS